MFPESLTVSIRKPINGAVDWLVVNYGWAFEAVNDAILGVLVPLEHLLRQAPWWLVLALFMGLAFHASRSWKLSLALGVVAFLVGVLGLWDMAMQTLALMLVSTLLAVLIGMPLGVVLASRDRLRSFVLPVLDLMQTMPSFVYLIPALMLFGLGKVPAILATLIYAMPPVIRLTDLGLRQVDKGAVEAAYSLGARPRLVFWRVKLPLALPSIMAGINQTTMLALSMVVIASMIGARGLGQEVLLGIQRLDVGRGAAAGLAIVALAVVLDRITQAYGRKAQAYRQVERA